ncbi:MAG: group II intron reverse transcriptase domain-containing protein [Gammaproteobacteria bacterium]|nr:group II intron reverse transcriptase domain-containing protein [Gammaproteobacteria bacterium]
MQADVQRSVTKTFRKLKKRKKCAGDASPWWAFVWDWPQKMQPCIERFINGSYHFEPMNLYIMPDEGVQAWNYQDTLFTRTLFEVLKPTFKKIISPHCTHLDGPVGVQKSLQWVHNALASDRYRYFMRLDIAGFYSSIQHNILIEQLQQHFQDPKVLDYLQQIITIPVIKNAAVHLPTQGLPRRSSLSPLLGAMYLSELDRAFENREGIFYLRYLDDIILLCKTKNQYLKARRKVSQILQKLKLTLSRKKSKTGPLVRGFHFLGLIFQFNEHPEESQNAQEASPQNEASKTHVSVQLHPRCSTRVHARLKCLEEDRTPVHKVSTSLALWAAWWLRASPNQSVPRSDCLQQFCDRLALREKGVLLWLGLKLLRDSSLRSSHRLAFPIKSSMLA